MNKLKQFINKERYSTLLFSLLLIVLAIFTTLKFSVMWSLSTWKSMAMQFPEFGVIAVGLAFCFVTGNVNLSTVALGDFASIIGVMIMGSVEDGSMIVPGILVALLIGVVGGYINGNLIARLNIPPLLATISTQQLFLGLSIAITDGKALTNVPALYTSIGHSMVLGFIPFPLLIFAVLFLIASFVFKYTVFGKQLYMVGANRQAAKFSAINTERTIISAFMINGAYSVVGALLMVSSYNSAKADYGISYTTTCMLIMILAGIMPAGGMGKMLNLLISVITVQIISTGVNMFPGINSYYRSFFWGILLVVMLIVNTLALERNKKLNLKALFAKRKAIK